MELATSSRLHSPPGHSSTPRQPPLAARQHPVPQPRHLARPITPSQSARKPVPRPAATAARASTSPDTRPARPRSLSQSATTDSKVLERAGSQESFRRKRGATNDPPNIDATPTAPLPFPTSSSHLSLVPGRARPKSPRLESRAVSSSSCPEPRGATVSTGGGPSRIAAVSKIMAEGELGPAGQRKAGEVLVELRDGRSVSSSECGGDDDDDDDVPVRAAVPRFRTTADAPCSRSVTGVYGPPDTVRVRLHDAGVDSGPAPVAFAPESSQLAAAPLAAAPPLAAADPLVPDATPVRNCFRGHARGRAAHEREFKLDAARPRGPDGRFTNPVAIVLRARPVRVEPRRAPHARLVRVVVTLERRKAAPEGLGGPRCQGRARATASAAHLHLVRGDVRPPPTTEPASESQSRD